MLLSAFLLLAVLSGESFATKPLSAALKPSTESEAAAPSKKHLDQFRVMINSLTNKSWYRLSDYGCWCGKGGEGKVVDELDRCCKIHDRCYTKAKDIKGCKWLEKGFFIQNYYDTWYKTRKGGIKCAQLKAYKNKKKGLCKFKLCRCDLRAAKCFARETYHPEFYDYDQSKCKE